MSDIGAAPTEPADLVVVGGGVLGLFTALAAAQDGLQVTLVDQFALPHTHGSSHGDSRIYRMAYTEPVYLDMMAQSLPVWRDLHADSPEPLLVETGCLALASSPSSELPPRLQALCAAYEARGLAHAVLDARAVADRFPQFELPPDMHAIHVEDGGILFADRCLAAAMRRLRALGASVRAPFRAAALCIPDSDDEPLTLCADDGATVRARRCVLAPGAWLQPVARRLLGLHVPTVASEETVSYYAPPNEDDLCKYNAWSGMPTFIYYSAGVDVYGIPSTIVPGVKAAGHFCGPTLGEHDADARAAEARGEASANCSGQGVAWGTRPERGAQIAASVDAATRFVLDCLPGLRAAPIKSVQCLYTRTCDAHLVVDVAPGSRGRVAVAGGGSGHAFKLAPAVGQCAVGLVMGRGAPVDLAELSMQRLTEGERELENEGKAKLKFR